jgi:YHS domain-containing protein
MKKIRTLAGIVLSLLPLFSFAQTSEVFSNESGAIKGYDPVAFFTESKAVKGTKEFTHEWNGATWHFASKKNQDLFVANPEKYAPQYGGYCAYGTADGHKAPTVTDTWTVVDSKLYFNYNQNVKVAWTKDQANLIKKADEQWPKIKKD